MPIKGFFKNTSVSRSFTPTPTPAPAPTSTIVKSFSPIKKTAKSVATKKFILTQTSNISSCKSCGG